METLHEFYVLTKGTEYLIAVAFLLLFPVFWRWINTPAKVPETSAVRAPEAADRIPAGVFIGPGHVWMRPEPSGAVAVGAGSLPISLLGGLDGLELRPSGSKIERGDPVAVLRRGERSLTLPSPVSGEISEFNAELETDPQRAAADPFGAGWLFRVVPRGMSTAFAEMFQTEDAVAWMRRELAKLRDAVTGQALSPAIASLPDGGLPVSGLAADLPDEVWKELSAKLFALEAGSDVVPPRSPHGDHGSTPITA